VSDGLLSIGAFSRASLVSIKQLRAYHESGLLVPVDVDPSTGYRRYSVDQLTDAAIILRLRSLDLPLAAVREVLEARDPERTRAVLATHQRVMEERLTEVERIVASLQDEPAALVNTPVHLRDEKATTILYVEGSVAEADFPIWLGQAYAQLDRAVATSGSLPTGPAGACYPPAIVDDGPQAIQAFVPVDAGATIGEEARVAGVRAGGLPAATCAVIVHVGGYESVGATYRALGAWVSRHAEPHPDLPVREHYLNSPADTDDPARFRTEICWPIASAESHP
jgi:DNA-binding transcriptional MerR regulator/DNA gyrase inhibitor GyrI